MKCQECGERAKLETWHTVDLNGDRNRELCVECSRGCVDCGGDGAIQRDDEWLGWLVCPICDAKRNGETKTSKQLRDEFLSSGGTVTQCATAACSGMASWRSEWCGRTIVSGRTIVALCDDNDRRSSWF